MPVRFTQQTFGFQPPGHGGAEEQAGNCEDGNVDQQGDVGAGDAVHNEWPPASHRVPNREQRDRQRQHRSTARSKSQRGPNHEGKQEVGVLRRLEK